MLLSMFAVALALLALALPQLSGVPAPSLAARQARTMASQLCGRDWSQPPQLLYARRRAMNPLAFEELLLESFEQRGHKVVCNRRYTGDGGIDEQVVINGAIWLIQAKRYAGAIRPEHIVAFDTLCQTRRCRGLFIHTGRTGPQSRVSASHNSAVEIISARSLFALLTSGPVPVSGVCSDPADPITSLRTTSGRAG